MTATTLPVGYTLDPAWHAERDRFDGVTSVYDARTLQLCERLGLSPGWDCLDAGAGTGSPAVAADSVGAAGSITALDSDTRFRAPLDSERLVVLESDLPAGPPGRTLRRCALYRQRRLSCGTSGS